MGISVLLVSTATRWFGTARMPRVLARAGFDVALLAPRGSLAEKSRFVARVGHLPDSATPKDWIYAFAATVKATLPRVVIPCDDMAFRLLDLLAQSPPNDMPSALQLQLGALIRESLGDPQHYATCIEKTLLPPAAQALGIRVAEHASAHIRGQIWHENVAAWQGKRLAGFAVDRLVAQGDIKGPAAVIRWFHSPELRDISERLASGLGMSGLFATECIVDERTGDAYLIEINRRLTPGMHVGSRIGVDLAAALYSALTGTPSSSRSDLSPGEEGIGVHFPQEWLRDPESRYLREYPVDVPWDDPDLLEAMMAMRQH